MATLGWMSECLCLVTPAPAVTPRGYTTIQMVSDLTDPNTGQLDKAPVNDIFWLIDARSILALPLYEEFDDELPGTMIKRNVQCSFGAQDATPNSVDGK